MNLQATLVWLLSFSDVECYINNPNQDLYNTLFFINRVPVLANTTNHKQEHYMKDNVCLDFALLSFTQSHQGFHYLFQ